MRAFGALAATVCFCSCVPTPESYPIPPQHAPMSAVEVISYHEFVRSADPNADLYYVKDVGGLEGGSWRWTQAAPEFRFTLKSTISRRFRLDFGLHEITFRDTGPVTLSILINGRELDRPHFDHPGDRRYEREVPADMLTSSSETRVVVRVLNSWKASDPGVHLGILLHAAGFVGP